MTINQDDSVLIDKWTTRLPELLIDRFMEKLLFSRVYNDNELEWLLTYEEYAEKMSFKFSDTGLQKLREKFDISNLALLDFLKNNFSPIAHGKLFIRFGLFVNIDGMSMVKAKEHTDTVKNQLDKLVTNFKENYTNLFLECRKYLKKFNKKGLPMFKGEEGQFSPHRLPVGARWEELGINFIDRTVVEVYFRGQFYKEMSHKDLLCFKSGTKDKGPDNQWGFLEQLSVLQATDPTKATTENMRQNKTSKDTLQQRKSTLSEKLRTVFGINDDPFEDYGQMGYYKPRFKLKPIPELRHEEVYQIGRQYDDNKNYGEEEPHHDESY